MNGTTVILERPPVETYGGNNGRKPPVYVMTGGSEKEGESDGAYYRDNR